MAGASGDDLGSGGGFTASGATGACSAANGTYQANGTHNGTDAFQNENGWWMWYTGTGSWKVTASLGNSFTNIYYSASGGSSEPPSGVWPSGAGCPGSITVAAQALWFSELPPIQEVFFAKGKNVIGINQQLLMQHIKRGP